MSFMARKKRYKFNVEVKLEELSSVPFINGLVFAKIRLVDGGSFNQSSPREEVQDHCVKWGSRFDFTCKMTANASSGILDSCIMRISVRKEVKGGRSSLKLGFIDLDLAEFAGAGLTCKRSLLQGYNNKHHRQDNSTLKFSIEMSLISGDPLFKRPSRNTSSFYTPLHEPGDADDSVDDPSGPSAASRNVPPPLMGESSTRDSFRHPDGGSNSSPSAASKTMTHSGDGHSSTGHFSMPTPQLVAKMGHPGPPTTAEKPFVMGHSRNSSDQSVRSKASAGYGSLPSHSRQGSSDDGNNVTVRVTSNSSNSDGGSKFNSTERKKGQMRMVNSGADIESRVDATRVNVEDVIHELVAANLAQTSEEVGEGNEVEEECGLQLYVGKDGTATLGSRSGTNQRTKYKALPKSLDTNTSTSHPVNNHRHHHHHQKQKDRNSNSSPNHCEDDVSKNRQSKHEEGGETNDLMLLVLKPEPSSQNGSRNSLNRCCGAGSGLEKGCE